jgi:streptomycin 6-kinase
MHDESLPAMPFPPPSGVLLERAGADAPTGQLRSWMYALPKTIRHYLSRWQAEWTGESLRQGYFGYVLPCRCQDGTAAILKLSPDVHGAEEQATALSAWAGEGAVPLLAKSFDENGAALLIGRIAPGIALRPQDDSAGQRIARCLKRLVSVPASSVRGSLPSGLERLDALIVANARHVRTLGPSLRRHQDKIMALADAVRGRQRPPDRAVLLHGDLHAGNLLIGGGIELVAIDPVPALEEPEQDIGDAAAKNDWGQDLSARVKQLAEACHADCTKATAYARLAAWNSGIFHTATGAESPGGVDPKELLKYATTEPG